MKNAKKLLALILAVVLALGLVACSNGDSTSTGAAISQSKSNLEKFVEEGSSTFVSEFEKSFAESSGGLTCKASIKAEGTSIIINCNIDGIDNMPDDVKAQLQAEYDKTKDSLRDAYSDIKKEVPELTSVIMNVCEEDGDILASVVIDY